MKFVVVFEPFGEKQREPPLRVQMDAVEGEDTGNPIGVEASQQVKLVLDAPTACLGNRYIDRQVKGSIGKDERNAEGVVESPVFFQSNLDFADVGQTDRLLGQVPDGLQRPRPAFR
jgi:hypothetical protein